MLKFYIFCAFLVPFGNSAKLPSYIKKCSIKDPNLSQCIQQDMNDVLPQLLKGNKELNIPKLSPFYLKEIVIEATKTLTLKLTDIYLYGLETAKFSNILADMVNGKAGTDILFETLDANATYEVDGQIMVLPIKGKGPFQVNLKNAKFQIKFDFDIFEKNGEKYVKVKNPSLNFETEHSRYHFDNLFNGNKELGDQINNFLEENWKDVSKDIQPAISETLMVIYMSILNRVAETIPFNELFLP